MGRPRGGSRSRAARTSRSARGPPCGIAVSEPLVEPDGRALDEVVALAAAGRLRVDVAATLSLESAREAHERLEGGLGGGKLVLEP